MISSFPLGRVTWPLLVWVEGRGGRQNASMKTTWREERAATKQKESERGRPTWAIDTVEEQQESCCRKASRTKVRSRTRGNTATRTRIRTTDQGQPSPPCQNPSEEKAPADSSCRTSSGERNKLLTHEDRRFDSFFLHLQDEISNLLKLCSMKIRDFFREYQLLLKSRMI